MSTRPSERGLRILREAEEQLLRDFPFHAGVVARWRPRPAPVATMGVSLRQGVLELVFNPRFLWQLEPRQRVAVLVHEIHHVIYGHIHVHPLSLARPDLFVLACEVTVNELIPRGLLPGEPATLDKFPDLPPNEDTATRYERLLADRKLSRRNDLPTPSRHHHAGWGRKDTLPRTPAGGDPDPALPDLWGPSPRSARMAAALRRFYRGVSGDTELLRIGDAASASGVDWRRIIAAQLPGGDDFEPSFRRPSRRFPHLVGVVPGSVRRRTRILAALDTSGSMHPDVLGLVNRELSTLARSFDVVVVQCDDKIRSVRPFTGPLADVEGRGDTDLRPPFAPDVMRDVRPDMLIYFTDGGGKAPAEAPIAPPVIWCLTPGGEKPAPWGTTVYLGRLAGT